MGKRHGVKYAAESSTLSKKANDDSDDSDTMLSRLPRKMILAFVIAFVVGVVHKNHLSQMFENDRHFSHLSTVERELTFRTEMGLYYSYYKSMVEAPSFLSGIQHLLDDNITEYPNRINTLKRFNIYPEVITASMFRVYNSIWNAMGWNNLKCYTINRGEGQSQVQSCEGLGEPIYFYVNIVFILNGACASVFFLYASYLSKSIFGGCIAILSFFYNHSESTRVQWTPPLRESFGFPFFVLQMFAVTYILRQKIVTFKHSVIIAIPLICFMTSWQFAQFSTLTQLLSVFVVYAVGGITSQKFLVILTGLGIGLISSFVLLFGNVLLLNSLLSTALITSLIIISLEPIINKLKLKVAVMVAKVAILITGMILGKYLLGKFMNIADDAHIGDILRSKFTDFRNFDTMLYTCAAEFDFMKFEMVYTLAQTLVLPVALYTITVVAISSTRFLLKRKSIKKDCLSPENNPEVLYNVMQVLAFAVMAIMLMRLKVFLLPHLSLIMCLLMCDKVSPLLHTKKFKHAVILIVAFMSVKMGRTTITENTFRIMMTRLGFQNINTELSIKGEFSNPRMEQMLEFVNEKLPQNAVFSGAMASMATIKLVTNRPIVNHPHYEDVELRRRTKLVYAAFSRKSLKDVHTNLVSLQAEYLLLEVGMCHSKAKPNCTLPEIFDLEDEENRGKPKTCEVFTKLGTTGSLHNNLFTRVFTNSGYEIYKILRID